MVSRRLSVLLGVVLLLSASPVMAAAAPSGVSRPTAISGDGINAYKLARHRAAVRFHKQARMWDCWEVGPAPRFSAWNGNRWVRWSVGKVSTDVTKCGTQSNKVVYDYYVSLRGRPVKDRAYNLLRVKEYCTGCHTSYWTLPVLPPGAAAGRIAR